MNTWKGIFAIVSVAAVVGTLVRPGDEPHEPVKLTADTQRRIKENERPAPQVPVLTERVAAPSGTLSAMPAASAPEQKGLCPLTDTQDSEQVLAQLAFQRVSANADPVDRFRQLGLADFELGPAGFAKLGVTPQRHAAALQDAAGSAFNVMKAKYPHGKLYSMDQAESVSAGSGKTPFELLRDIHMLRWSMMNLVVGMDGKADLAQSVQTGGIETDLLGRLVAKLVIESVPEAVAGLKTLADEKGRLDEEQLDRYDRYIEILKYATGDAHTIAGKPKPSWEELGFKDFKDWRTLRNASDADLSRRKDDFVKDVAARCNPQTPGMR